MSIASSLQIFSCWHFPLAQLNIPCVVGTRQGCDLAGEELCIRSFSFTIDSVCVHACMHVCVHADACLCMCMHIHVLVYMYVCIFGRGCGRIHV